MPSQHLNLDGTCTAVETGHLCHYIPLKLSLDSHYKSSGSFVSVTTAFLGVWMLCDCTCCCFLLSECSVSTWMKEQLCLQVAFFLWVKESGWRTVNGARRDTPKCLRSRWWTKNITQIQIKPWESRKEAVHTIIAHLRLFHPSIHPSALYPRLVHVRLVQTFSPCSFSRMLNIEYFPICNNHIHWKMEKWKKNENVFI